MACFAVDRHLLAADLVVVVAVVVDPVPVEVFLAVHLVVHSVLDLVVCSEIVEVCFVVEVSAVAADLVEVFLAAVLFAEVGFPFRHPDFVAFADLSFSCRSFQDYAGLFVLPRQQK